MLLDGIRVVELTEALAGPYCAMMLGDFGAEVIKVERPGIGDQSRTWGPPFVGSESAYFLATNRNKRSLTINYDHPAGGEILHRLLARTDVFICNQPSLASLQRRGIDPATLRARHPRLIYCAISGYGVTGPKAGQPGYDILAHAEAGVDELPRCPRGRAVAFSHRHCRYDHRDVRSDGHSRRAVRARAHREGRFSGPGPLRLAIDLAFPRAPQR